MKLLSKQCIITRWVLTKAFPGLILRERRFEMNFRGFITDIIFTLLQMFIPSKDKSQSQSNSITREYLNLCVKYKVCEE